jgi:hypothetical protein
VKSTDLPSFIANAATRLTAPDLQRRRELDHVHRQWVGPPFGSTRKDGALHRYLVRRSQVFAILPRAAERELFLAAPSGVTAQARKVRAVCFGNQTYFAGGGRQRGPLTMITDHYEDRTIANMEVALGRACDRFPGELANHKARKRIAAKLLECATSGERTLQGFTDAAMAAAVITSRSHHPA